MTQQVDDPGSVVDSVASDSPAQKADLVLSAQAPMVVPRRDDDGQMLKMLRRLGVQRYGVVFATCRWRLESKGEERGVRRRSCFVAAVGVPIVDVGSEERILRRDCWVGVRCTLVVL